MQIMPSWSLPLPVKIKFGAKWYPKLAWYVSNFGNPGFIYAKDDMAYFVPEKRVRRRRSSGGPRIEITPSEE